jgi:hypothetical protein
MLGVEVGAVRVGARDPTGVAHAAPGVVGDHRVVGQEVETLISRYEAEQIFGARLGTVSTIIKNGVNSRVSA